MNKTVLIALLIFIVVTIINIRVCLNEPEPEVITYTFIVPAIEVDSSGTWNSKQFQRAIDLMELRNVDGVIIPPGTFTIGEQITIPSSISIILQGMDSSTVKMESEGG